MFILEVALLGFGKNKIQFFYGSILPLLPCSLKKGIKNNPIIMVHSAHFTYM